MAQALQYKTFSQSKPFSIQSKLKALTNYVTNMTERYFDPRQAPTSFVMTLNKLVHEVYKEITHLDHVAFIEESVETVVENFWTWSDRKICTVKEMAKQLGKSVSTIYRWIKQGKLSAKKEKGRWQVIA